jgi:hypothetical protein
MSQIATVTIKAASVALIVPDAGQGSNECNGDLSPIERTFRIADSPLRPSFLLRATVPASEYTCLVQ